MLPGTGGTDEQLRQLGFVPFELVFEPSPVSWPGGGGINWTTLGTVPDSAGLYAFTVGDVERLHVTYVGRTSHLWMVAKGGLPRSAGPGPVSVTAARAMPAPPGNASTPWWPGR